MPFYANACRVKNQRICTNKKKKLPCGGDICLTAALLTSGGSASSYRLQ